MPCRALTMLSLIALITLHKVLTPNHLSQCPLEPHVQGPVSPYYSHYKPLQLEVSPLKLISW